MISVAAALESKVSNLEEQLSAEAQERMIAAKNNRNNRQPQPKNKY